MEVLDTSIANVALRHIAGGLAAGSGREHLGGDHQPSRRQRRGAADQRLAVRRGRAQAVLHDLRRPVHRQLAAVRHGDQPGDADRLPGAAGARRRRAGPERAVDPGRQLPAGEAGPGLRRLRHRRDRRPHLRPPIGGCITDNYSWHWIFPDQRADGHRLADPGAVAAGRA